MPMPAGRDDTDQLSRHPHASAHGMHIRGAAHVVISSHHHRASPQERVGRLSGFCPTPVKGSQLPTATGDRPISILEHVPLPCTLSFSSSEAGVKPSHVERWRSRAAPRTSCCMPLWRRRVPAASSERFQTSDIIPAAVVARLQTSCRALHERNRGSWLGGLS